MLKYKKKESRYIITLAIAYKHEIIVEKEMNIIKFMFKYMGKLLCFKKDMSVTNLANKF